MVEECVHILANGRKCRRIPKRGQKLCTAHRPHRRRRAPMEENEAFHREMSAFVDRLHQMPLDTLLYETTGLLAEVLVIIDRRSSRRDRIAFTRASSAVGIAADRFAELNQRSPQPSAPQPQPPQPAAPPAMEIFTPATRARFQELEALLNSGTLPPDEFDQVCNEMLKTLDSIEKTSPALRSNT